MSAAFHLVIVRLICRPTCHVHATSLIASLGARLERSEAFSCRATEQHEALRALEMPMRTLLHRAGCVPQVDETSPTFYPLLYLVIRQSVHCLIPLYVLLRLHSVTCLPAPPLTSADQSSCLSVVMYIYRERALQNVWSSTARGRKLYLLRSRRKLDTLQLGS